MGDLESNRNIVAAPDGTEVIITGTGVPSINPARAGAGVLVRHRDTVLHFDAGRGTATRVVEAGIDVSALSALFLTHYHSDHVIGLDDFLLGRWVEDDDDLGGRLALVAPNGSTVRHCERVLELWDHDLHVRAQHNGRSTDLKIDVVGFDVGDDLVEVWSNDDVRVLAGQVRHEPVVGAVGYRIETPDGVVAISGDTLVCPEVAALAEGADVVVYEAIRMKEVLAMSESLRFITDYHADTVLIGEQMAELNIATLMLTHLIPSPETEQDKQGFVDDVRSGGYTGEVLVCDDLDRWVLEPRDGSLVSRES